MGRLIDADVLYKAMQDAEDLARQRVLDTESTLPYPNNLNPSYTRYLAQMDERTKAKHMIADAPTVDAVEVVRCKDCKHNPLDTWFDCPIAHLKYDGDRWCWKGERKDGKNGKTG